MVKRTVTQVLLTHPFYPSKPTWVTLEPSGKFTGQCRRIGSGETEREVEIRLTTASGPFQWTTWLSPKEIRTVEYFECDEAPE